MSQKVPHFFRIKHRFTKKKRLEALPALLLIYEEKGHNRAEEGSTPDVKERMVEEI